MRKKNLFRSPVFTILKSIIGISAFGKKVFHPPQLQNPKLQPLSAHIPLRKKDPTDQPVREHTDPYGYWSYAQAADEEDTQGYPAEPHGKTGNDHGIFDIPGGPQCIGGDEGRHPDQRFYNRDKRQEPQENIHAFRFHA